MPLATGGEWRGAPQQQILNDVVRHGILWLSLSSYTFYCPPKIRFVPPEDLVWLRAWSVFIFIINWTISLYLSQYIITNIAYTIVQTLDDNLNYTYDFLLQILYFYYISVCYVCSVRAWFSQNNAVNRKGCTCVMGMTDLTVTICTIQ